MKFCAAEIVVFQGNGENGMESLLENRKLEGVMAQRCHENKAEKPNQQVAGKGGNGWQR